MKKTSDKIEQARSKKTCFVVTPIGSDDSDIRRHIDGIIDEAIVPIFKDYEIIVSHRIYDIGSINKQILRIINQSELVIANLTNLNPNVMYELAVRHALGKPVITIAEKGTNIPFDVIDSRTIFYINDPKGMKNLRDDMLNFFSEIDFDREDYGPVFETYKEIGYESNLVNMISSDGNEQMGDLIEKLIGRIDKLESLEGLAVGKELGIKSIRIFTTGDLTPMYKEMQAEIQAIIGSFYESIEIHSNSIIINFKIGIPKLESETYKRKIVNYITSKDLITI